MRHRGFRWLAVTTALVLSACSSGPSTPPNVSGSPARTATSIAAAPQNSTRQPATSARPSPTPSVRRVVPSWDHIVVAVLENHSVGELAGNPDAPFLNHLIATGAHLTNSFAVTHPSEPNYLALFSGSTQGLTDDSCPHAFRAPNLATALAHHHRTFVGYSEDLPSTGYLGCWSGSYARKHNPWSDFPAVPATANQPLTGFPAQLSSLPNVAFVIPNLDHDMHDGSIASADAWLRAHLGAYAAWAGTHNSLLIVTTDEDDLSADNHILTVLAGAHVRRGPDAERVNHYSVLRTILAAADLQPFAEAARAQPITQAWTTR